MLEKKKQKSKLSMKESSLLNNFVLKRDKKVNDLFKKEVETLEMLQSKQDKGQVLEDIEILLLNSLNQTHSVELKKD